MIGCAVIVLSMIFNAEAIEYWGLVFEEGRRCSCSYCGENKMSESKAKDFHLIFGPNNLEQPSYLLYQII